MSTHILTTQGVPELLIALLDNEGDVFQDQLHTLAGLTQYRVRTLLIRLMDFDLIRKERKTGENKNYIVLTEKGIKSAKKLKDAKSTV